MTYPLINKPEELARLLRKIGEIDVPQAKIDGGFFRKQGFSASTGKGLMAVLKGIGFVDAQDSPSAIWREYAMEKKGQATVLARAIRNTYPELFRLSSCPYLEADEEIVSILKGASKANSREAEAMLNTFRTLSDLADFQELLAYDTPGTAASSPVGNGSAVKVNPNLQLNIEVHIDPATPDDKIEAIFRNMRKYLLDKNV
jgi:hypothetical protein